MGKSLRPQTRAVSAELMTSTIGAKSKLEIALPCVIGNTVIAASESYRCGDFMYQEDFQTIDTYSHAVSYQSLRLLSSYSTNLHLQKGIPILEVPSSRLFGRFIFNPRTAEPPAVTVPYTVTLNGLPARTSTDFFSLAGVDGELFVADVLLLDNLVNLENYSFINMIFSVSTWFDTYDIVFAGFTIHKIIT